MPRPGTYTLRSDGRYWDAATSMTSLQAVTGWGRSYLVTSIPSGVGSVRYDVAIGQKVRPGSALSAAWQRRVGRTWLLTNEVPSSVTWVAPAGLITSILDLPGFLEFSFGQATVDAGYSDTLGAMFLVVPMAVGRDQNDIDVVTRDGQEWLRLGHGMLRPLDGVPALAAGADSTSIGSEGYAEWRSIPSDGSLAVAGATDWKLYTKDLVPLASGSGPAQDVDAPQDSLLVVFAAAGSTVTTTLA